MSNSFSYGYQLSDGATSGTSVGKTHSIPTLSSTLNALGELLMFEKCSFHLAIINLLHSDQNTSHLKVI